MDLLCKNELKCFFGIIKNSKTLMIFEEKIR